MSADEEQQSVTKSVYELFETTKASLESSLDAVPDALPDAVATSLEDHNIHLHDADGHVNRATTLILVVSIVATVACVVLVIVSAFCLLEARRQRLLAQRKRAVRAMMHVEEESCGEEVATQNQLGRRRSDLDRIPLVASNGAQAQHSDAADATERPTNAAQEPLQGGAAAAQLQREPPQWEADDGREMSKGASLKRLHELLASTEQHVTKLSDALAVTEDGSGADGWDDHCDDTDALANGGTGAGAPRSSQRRPARTVIDDLDL